MATQSQPPAKQGNVLTRKIGPLPMWAWTSIVLVVVIGYSLYKARQNANTAAASTTSPTGTDASQVPQFVNQTYVSPTPPSAPGSAGATGPAGPQGPAGTPGPSAPGVGSPPIVSTPLAPGPVVIPPTGVPGHGIAGGGAGPALGNKYDTAASKKRAAARKKARIKAR